MNKTDNLGLKALADVSGVEAPFTTYHAGFVFGPRVNAGSRVGQSDLGARLFTTADANEAREMAWTLNDCNDKRKGMQVEMEAHAMRLVEEQGIENEPVIIVASEGWHSGLTGLVAGRLKEKYGRPVCVICLENGMGKGSGRSIPGVHMGHIFLEAQADGVVQKGGGHAMAGGFTVPADQVDHFCAFAKDHVLRQLNGEMPIVESEIDTVLTVRGGLSVPAVKMLEEKVGPFGAAFPEPLIMLPEVRIHSADIVGADHIRLLMSDADGGPRMKAMAFRAVGTDMGQAFLKEGRRSFHIVGCLKVNAWQGRETAELHVRDAAFADV